MEESKEAKKPKKEVVPKGMTQAKAEKLAKTFLPKKEAERFEKIVVDGKQVNSDKFDVMYVTSDSNVFYKKSRHSAIAHARKNKLELFECKM